MALLGQLRGMRPGIIAGASTRPRVVLTARPARGAPWRRIQGGRSGLPVRAAAPQAPAQESGEDEEAYYDEDYGEEEEVDYSRPFPAEIPMDPNTAALAGIPLALYYPGVLALAAGAGLVGQGAGRAFPVEREHRDVVGYAVAAAAAGTVLYGGVQGKKTRDRAAVVDLFNLLVGMEEPTALTPDDVKAVGDKYGINMQKEQLEGLQQVFGHYLEHTVPTAETQLRGDEAPKIIAFKEALGLSDEEAAPVFIDVGRRLSAKGYETKDRQAEFEQRKAFQRLIYLSYLVFGDQKAAFLLPWRRVFNMNDSQLFVARRDNARDVFAAHIKEECGGDLPADRTVLRELRDFQSSVKLMDDVAEGVVREAARAHVEKRLAAAVEVMRKPAKDRNPAIILEEVSAMLDYGRKLVKLSNEDDLVPGLGLPSIRGGEWDAESKKRDIREVFKTFAEESVARAGSFTPQLESDLKELASMLALSAKDAGDARATVAAQLYRRLLREEVASKRIDAAESPAQVLGDLVGRAGFSPEAALELHKGLYRQKLEQLVAKKRLTDEDAADLARIRRVLCIPQDAANEVIKATSGRVLEDTLSEVLLAGVRPLSAAELERVDAAIKDLRMDRDVAKAVFAEVARARLKAIAGQAVKDLQANKKAAALGLKKLVQFNSLVVAPLLERVAGTEAAKKELADLLAKAAEEAKKEEAAKKAEEAANPSSSGGEEGGDKPSSSEAAPAQTALEAAIAEAKAAEAKAAEAKAAEAKAAEAKDAGAEAAKEGDDKKEDAAAEAAPQKTPEEEEAEEAEAKAKAEAALREAEEAARKLAEEERRKKEEADPVFQVKKMIAASRGEFGEEEKRTQKEITLEKDVDKSVRAELYKTYLMFSMSGDIVELPVGGVIRKKTSTESRQSEMARLQHLSEILGMNQIEVASVHQDLSEQAFKAQAQEVLRGTGALTPERKQYLDDMRKQLQVPEDKAEKIIREIRTEVMGASAALDDAGGQKWTVERVLEASKEGIDVAKALEEPARRVLLRRELDKRLGDGKAAFDSKLLLEELPKILGIEQKRVDTLLRELVGSRKRMLLVQAISQHRQKRGSDAVTSLNNLISAYRALPEKGGVGAVQWGEHEELKELFATYCAKVDAPEAQDELASLFGLSEAERDAVRSSASTPAARAKQQQEEQEEESWF